MKKDLTLSQLRAAKRTCETRVLAAVQEFEAETGLSLTSVSCFHEQRVIGGPLTITVTAKDGDVTLGFGNDNFPF